MTREHEDELLKVLDAIALSSEEELSQDELYEFCAGVLWDAFGGSHVPTEESI